MRLTPLDIRKQEFSHKMRGYDVDEVTAFLQMLANQWEELQDENRRREEKIRELGGKLRHYEKVEEALQEALQTARESSRAVLQNAEEKAGLMIARAEARADDITQQAERERHDLKRETAKLSGRRSEIVTRLRAFLMSEMEMLARYEGDDPVGFIRLLPTDEGNTRRLSDRPEEHQVSEGRPPGSGPARESPDAPGQSAAEGEAGEEAPGPPHGTPSHGTPPHGKPSHGTLPHEIPSYGKPPQEAPDYDVPARDPLHGSPMQPQPDSSQPDSPQPDSSQPDRSQADRSQPHASAQDTPHPDTPHPDTLQPPQPAPTSDGPSEDEAQPDVPPATESPSLLHEAGEGGPHESRDPGIAAPKLASDRERDEENVEGPGWTARTVVSRPSELRSAPPERPRHADHDEDAGESEDDGETQTGASSEEIEKIRRILSGLD